MRQLPRVFYSSMDVILASGARLIIHEELGSTNEEAKCLFADGEREPCWVLARLQTAGYGRRGRAWSQQKGDFSGSLLWPLGPFPPSAGGASISFNPALASFAAAISLDLALQSLGLEQEKISLKWPNDVRVNGAKIAGLLLELVTHDEHQALVIGIGVNIVSAPQIPDYATTKLADHMSQASLPRVEAFVAALDRQLNQQLRFLAKAGFADIRTAWLARAEGLGQQVQVRLPNETLVGVFCGIDESGALRLCIGGGAEKTFRAITSGEVFFSSTLPNSC